MAAGNRPAVTVDSADTRRAMGRMGDRLDDVSRIDDRGAELVAETARQLAPRRTGALIDSIEILPGGLVTSALDYSAPVHQGVPSKNIPAVPFFSDAASLELEQVLGLHRENIADLLTKYDRETPG